MKQRSASCGKIVCESRRAVEKRVEGECSVDVRCGLGLAAVAIDITYLYTLQRTTVSLLNPSGGHPKESHNQPTSEPHSGQVLRNKVVENAGVTPADYFVACRGIWGRKKTQIRMQRFLCRAFSLEGL